MEYRKAVLADVEALSRMRVDMLLEEGPLGKDFQALMYENTRQYIAQGLKGGTFSAWVAAEGDAILAMGGAAWFTLPPNDWCPGGRTAYIGNLYTLPNRRRQGIATRLLKLLLDEAKARGCQRVLLNASDMGRPLYEKAGFVPWHDAMALYPLGIKPNASS